MENSLAVARTLYSMYEMKFNQKMDQMKMHKLMYFAQRESFIRENHKLFDESFYGWKYGPVLHSVRSEYDKQTPFAEVSGEVSKKTIELLKDIIDRYGDISSWNLSMMSHEEISWQLARTGLEASENGNRKLSEEAIQLDAVRESIARKST